MRMTTMILVLAACVAAPVAATAGDDNKAEVAQLQAELARVNAELKHLKQAYNQMSATEARSTNALTQLTTSLNAAREMLAALTTDNAAVRAELATLRSEVLERPADDPGRLTLELLDAKKALGGAQKALQAEQRARTRDTAQLTERILAETERANRNVIRVTNAENELAIVQAKLQKAEARIKTLQGDR